jgi:MFS family permease
VSEPTRLTRNQRTLAIGLVLGVSLVAFEITAVATVLPTISDELGGDSLFGVALASYTLANLVALVATGELADRFGPRIPYLLCIGVFVSGLLVASLATTMTMVVAGRTLQGMGTGGLGPVAYVLVKRAFPEDRQPVMYAWLSAGWVLPSLIAPLVAGAVTEFIGWRWVFAGIIPLALAVAAFIFGPMGTFEASPDGDRVSKVPAAFVAAAGVGLFVTGLQFAAPVAFVIAVIVGGTAALLALRRLLPRGVIVAAIGLPAILAARLLATSAFLGVDSFVPLAADRIHGVGPLAQGFVIIGAALTWSIGQWWIAHHQEIRPQRAVGAGFALLAVGIALTSLVLWASVPLPVVFVAWMVGGLGMGILFNPTSVGAMSFAVDGNEGERSSQVQLCDALGFSVMGGVGGATVAVSDRTDWPLTSALAVNFAIAGALAITGVFVARRIRPAISERNHAVSA